MVVKKEWIFLSYINGISFVISGITELLIDFNFNGSEKGTIALIIIVIGMICSAFSTMATAVMPISLILSGILLDYIPVWSIVLLTGLASLITAICVFFNRNLKSLGANELNKAA